jgi:hypothetical protein
MRSMSSNCGDNPRDGTSRGPKVLKLYSGKYRSGTHNHCIILFFRIIPKSNLTFSPSSRTLSYTPRLLTIKISIMFRSSVRPKKELIFCVSPPQHINPKNIPILPIPPPFPRLPLPLSLAVSLPDQLLSCASVDRPAGVSRKLAQAHQRHSAGSLDRHPKHKKPYIRF